jgi:hypothetical protein
MGGAENEEMHEVLNNLKAAERSLTSVPIFGKLVMVFIAIRNLPSMKTISGFRNFDLGLAVCLNNSPVRCNYFPLCLEAFNWGELVT